MRDAITVETDIFEHRQVGPHFINPCCFGEDFAAWLKGELSSLEEGGFTFSNAIQEDYGWGFWATHGRDRFWIALSYMGEGPQEEPPQWVVSIDSSGNLISRLVRRPNQHAFALLRDRTRQAIAANAAIKRMDA
jgi:hypothetical protein